MNINFTQVRKYAKERYHQKRIEAQPIGSAIKFKRKAMDMTLEEGSENICSVSYLSKLENSQIELSEQFTQPLLERFGLEHYYDGLTDDLYDRDLEVLTEHFIRHTKPEHSIIEGYLHRADYQSMLIHMLFDTLYGRYDKAIENYQHLKMYIPNLSDMEFSLFMICTSIHLYHKNKHQLAFRLLSLVPDVSQLNQHLSLLTLKWRLMNAFKMHRISEVMTTYPIYINQVIDNEYYHLLQEMRSAYVQFEAYFKHPSEIEKTISKMNALDDNARDFALAKSYFFHQQYAKSSDISKRYYKCNCEWLIIHLLALDYEHNTDEINDILIERSKLNLECDTASVLLNHLKHKYQGNKDELLNYLRREILGVKHLTDEYHILDYLMMDSQRLFSGYQFYKEASLVSSKFWMRLKDLKTSTEHEDERKGD